MVDVHSDDGQGELQVSVAKKDTRHRAEEVAVFNSVSREWWIPHLGEEFHSAIAAAVLAIERSVEVPSDYCITSDSVSRLEEYTEDWPSDSAGFGCLGEDPLVYAEIGSEMCENPEIHDGMDLDAPVEVQLAVKTSLPGKPTVMVSTPLGALLSDFMAELRKLFQIQMDRRCG